MLRKEELENLEKAMRELQESAREKNAALEQEQKILSAQKAAVDRDYMNMQTQLQALMQEKMSLQEMKKEAQEMLNKAESMTEVCNKILSEEKNLNGKFLEFCEREGHLRKQPTREFVEYLYKKFLKERRENMSPWQKEMLRLRAERQSQGNVKTSSYDSEPNIIMTDNVSDYSL